MTTFITILLVLLVWCLQALIAVVINIARPTRIAKNRIDFMKLTFAPYVIYCKLFNDKALD